MPLSPETVNKIGEAGIALGIAKGDRPATDAAEQKLADDETSRDDLDQQIDEDKDALILQYKEEIGASRLAVDNAIAAVNGVIKDENLPTPPVG